MSTVALVSGASRGIGAAIARSLAQRAHHVIVNYHRNADAAKQVVADIEAAGGTAQAEQADVCDDASVTALVSRVHAAYGRVDVLVCNANTVPPPFEPLASLPWDAFAGKVVGELAGSYHLTQRVLPIMREQRAGRIIYISSTLADKVGMIAAHSTAKAALNTFSRHVAADAGQYGVTVNTIALGAVNTDATAGFLDDDRRASFAQRSVHGRVLEPEDIGAAVALLADGGFGSVTGQVIRLDAGFDVLSQQLAPS
ncbi:SDR family oxidoreductase [Actinocrispum sp. NPDC049592]|uniref:SDR family oxidoreductase n=1 Tax=Actinocrispum sp. NPDC049592 TaxID=3154835 RepID=UPI00341A24B4